MRVISGLYRGRRFDPPAGLGIRPTTDRAREALFNLLSHRFELAGARVLDLFAGSGAVAVEFLSRGAASVTTVEIKGQVVQYLLKLKETLHAENLMVVHAPAERFLTQTADRYDLVFLDPPYGLPNKAALVETLLQRSLLLPQGGAVLEHPAPESYAHLPGYSERRDYGLTAFSFFLA